MHMVDTRSSGGIYVTNLLGLCRYFMGTLIILGWQPQDFMTSMPWAKSTACFGCQGVENAGWCQKPGGEEDTLSFRDSTGGFVIPNEKSLFQTCREG